MNFDPSDITAGPLRDRQKIGASLADIDPMTIDRSVSAQVVKLSKLSTIIVIKESSPNAQHH